MQTVATQSNLSIKSFKPAPIVTKQLHAEWPIALELDGTYHNLAIFFDRVGKFTRIVNITGVDIKGKAKPEPNSTISATCMATTFVLLDKPLPPKPGPAQPGKPGVAQPAACRQDVLTDASAAAVARAVDPGARVPLGDAGVGPDGEAGA